MSSCTCDFCRSACHTEPGAYLPSELSTEDATHMFRAGQLDIRQRNGVLYFTPATQGHTRHGTCVFLVDERCSVYDRRPFECARMLHSDTRRTVLRRLDGIVSKWATPAHAARLHAIESAKEKP